MTLIPEIVPGNGAGLILKFKPHRHGHMPEDDSGAAWSEHRVIVNRGKTWAWCGMGAKVDKI